MYFIEIDEPAKIIIDVLTNLKSLLFIISSNNNDLLTTELHCVTRRKARNNFRISTEMQDLYNDSFYTIF